VDVGTSVAEGEAIVRLEIVRLAIAMDQANVAGDHFEVAVVIENLLVLTVSHIPVFNNYPLC
jgi:hypothetical protein